MIQCRNCGQLNKNQAKYCRVCGNLIIAQNLFCPSCQKQVKEGANFCKFCGGKINNASQSALNQGQDAAPKTTNPKRKKWLIPVIALSAITVLLIFFVIVLVTIPLLEPISSPLLTGLGLDLSKFSQDTGDYVLSAEQKKLFDSLGYPDEYVIVFDNSSNPSRSEVWPYTLFSRSFFLRMVPIPETKKL